MRSVRSEVLSAATVLSIPLGILLSFPFGAFGFKAVEEVRHPARAAFVKLTSEAEDQAVRTVRAAWKEKTGGSRPLQIDLLCKELPDDGRFSVLSVRDRSRLPEPPTVQCERTSFLPSQKAPPPVSLEAESATEILAFPRKELLKLN